MPDPTVSGQPEGHLSAERLADEIVFMDPPAPSQGNHGDWERRLAPLRERPNEWARVRTGAAQGPAYSSARMIKGGMYRGLVKGEFDAVCRRGEAGSFDVFARYVGETS